MSKFNNKSICRTNMPADRLIAILLLALLPVTAQAADSHRGAAPAKGSSTGSAVTYELRCWQEGRLILQERVLKMPKTGSSQSNLRLQDRHGRPIRVHETRNAICLTKTVAPRSRRFP